MPLTVGALLWKEVPMTILSQPLISQLALIDSFVSSSLMGQTVVVVLLLCSVMSWTAMAFKFSSFKRTVGQNKRFVSAFRKESHPLAIFLKQKRYPDSPSYCLYLRSCQTAARTLGIAEADIGDLLNGTQAHHLLNSSQLQIIRESAERELADQVLYMEKDMSVLATTTTIAPFLGLLGTVWGVMDAFNGMAVTGAPTLSTVAPGISAALLTTVVGLIVAIPTVVGYNQLSVILRNETVGMDNFVQELIGEFHHAYVREN
ncbi:MotA/TolQ/ExbB proton channel family protein [Kiritimatiellota bacterium B12222]|nr:MotA/TolQ/ExbB proton channel family protein [Kiritimatiellota bacterium B12222]